MKTAERNPAALEFSREAVENTTAIADAAVRVFDELGAFALNDIATRKVSAAALVTVIRSFVFIRAEAARHPDAFTAAAIEKAATAGIHAATEMANTAAAPSGASVIARRAPATLAKLKACRTQLLGLRGQLG